MPKRGQKCRCGRHVWNGYVWKLIVPDDAPPPKASEKPTVSENKHCAKCSNFIPDDHALCDFHLREKYNLQWEGVYLEGWDRLYPEDVVLAALRAVERSHD